MKKALHFVLALAFCTALCLGLSRTAFAESGQWGDLSWNLDANGVLTITGSGEMDDLGNQGNLAWQVYADRIKEVRIGYGITNIGQCAFFAHKHMTAVSIPSSVEAIEHWAFSECAALESITIPDSVTSIGEIAFSGCSSLTEVTIPAGVSSLDRGVFTGCAKLKGIRVDKNNAHYQDIDGILFTRDGTVLKQYPLTKTGAYVIPSSVVEVEDYAFYECTGLTGIEIPPGVSRIGFAAFYECTGLTKITLPHRLTEIIDSSLQSCENLTELVIPEGIRKIGFLAFSQCYGLKSVTIPASVTEIDHYAFQACQMSDIYYGGIRSQWDAISVGVANEILSTSRLHCRQPDFLLPAMLGSVGSEAFARGAFVYAVVPANVTEIGPRAFADCPNLRYVEIRGKMTGIDSTAFSGVTGLTVIGTQDSTAAQYARQHGFAFVPAA